MFVDIDSLARGINDRLLRLDKVAFTWVSEYFNRATEVKRYFDQHLSKHADFCKLSNAQL